MESVQSNPGSSNGQRDLVAFRLDRQTYALPIEPLVQIIEMVTITSVPQLDSSVEGVINMRGVAVPVVDLRRHLGLPQAPLQLRTPIVLVQVGQWTVGLIVDEVLDVLKLSGGRVARMTDILPEGLGEAPVLQGLAHTADGTVLLLDPEHLFRASDKQALAQAVETLPQVVENRILDAWATGETSPAETARGNKA